MEWHLRQAWEPLLFEDEELTVDRRRRDPVAPAQASESARRKKKTHVTLSGLPVYITLAAIYIVMSLPIAWLARTVDAQLRAKVAR